MSTETLDIILNRAILSLLTGRARFVFPTENASKYPDICRKRAAC